MRVKDQNLRRAETELDSVNFRNKQLEHRVQVIQDDLQKNSRSGNSKSKVRDNQVTGNGQIDPIIMEDYQKRIIENAQLASTVIYDENTCLCNFYEIFMFDQIISLYFNTKLAQKHKTYPPIFSLLFVFRFQTRTMKSKCTQIVSKTSNCNCPNT